MKKLLSMLLAVSMLFGLFPAALAEDAAAYQPGSITKDLFIDAFERGDMILLDLQYSLTLGENAEEILGEDAAALAAIAKALPGSYLSLGVGKLEDGLRLMLGAEYAPDETQSAYASVLLDLTYEGLSVRSTAIEGERLTIKWETLLSLAGLSDSDISTILSLRDTDMQTPLTELIAQIEPLMARAAQLAAPYGETIAAHVAALPMDVATDVPAQEGFPAVATEVYVQVTPKAFGDMILALADQLEQDTTLCALLDMVLSEADMTTAELCAAVRESFADMTDESAVLHVYVGLDETDTPLYVHAFEDYDDGSSSVVTLMCCAGETEGSTAVSFDIIDLTAEGEVSDGISVGCEFIADPLDKNVIVLGSGFVFFADGEPLVQAEFYANSAAITTEDGQSGYAATYAMDMNAADGETEVSMTLSLDSMQSLTADGGEQSGVVGTIEMTSDGVQIPISLESYMLTAPSLEGTPSVMTEIIRIPALGIDEYLESMTLYTAAYDGDLTANTTEIAFEAATSEELEALATRAVTSLSETASALLEMLPPELVEMISEASADLTEDSVAAAL